MNEHELYHHGIKGQRWGVRRYQNVDGTLTYEGRKRQAKRYQRDLNKLDKEATKMVSRRIKSNVKLNDFSKKTLNKADGDISKISDKDTLKAMKLKSKDDKNLKQYKDIEATTWKLIGRISNEGYSIESEKVRRSIQDGSDFVAGILGGYAGIGINIARKALKYEKYRDTYFDQTPYDVEGNKYRVRA